MEFHGLFQYWSDFDEKSVTSIRYSIGDFSGPNASVFSIWKTSQESLNGLLSKIEELATSILSGMGYMENLEKLGGYLEDLIHFYHAGYDSSYSGLRKLADSKLPLSLVKIAISALEGNLHGLMEAKAALKVVSHILEMPRLSNAFLESSGLSHLFLLFTHQLASSQLQTKIISSFHAIISIPKNSTYFFEKDLTSSLDPKIAQMNFTFPKRTKKDDNKKQKTEEEVCCKTAYQILLAMFNEKKSIKVTNAIKVLLNKCSLFYSLQKINSMTKAGDSCLSIMENIRRNLKLHMLRSSSHCFSGVKHELLNFVLLESGNNIQNLQDCVQFLSQSILTNSLADWLYYTNFLPNLLSLFIFQTSTLEDFRIAFINISDILLMLIRSQGGFMYLSNHAEVLTGFIQALQSLLIPGQSEDAEFNLLEEEYLLSVVTPEKLSSYAKQLSLILTFLLKFSEFISQIKNGETLEGLNGLYGFLNAEDITTLSVATFYQIVKYQPEILIWIAEQLDFSSESEKLKSFYILEILKTVLIEDRSGEILVAHGQELGEIINNCNTDFSELRESLEIISEWLKPVSKAKNIEPEALLSDIFAVTKQKKDKNSVSIENKAAYLVIEENAHQDIDLCFFGELGVKGSVIIQLLPMVRILNLVLSTRKWASISCLNKNCLPIFTNIITKVTSILHTLITKSHSKEVFNILNSGQIKQEHFELLLPCINIFNIILEQLVGCELLMYNNSVLLESLLHLSSLCEMQTVGGEITKAKILRTVKTTFILWAKLPNFCDIYLPVIFEHAFQYPFKKSAVLGIIASIFEFYVSSKDPNFNTKCVEFMAKDHSIAFFNPCLVYHSIIQSSNVEAEYKTMAHLQLPYSRVKDSTSSKYEIRNSWEHKRLTGMFLDCEGSIIDKFFRILFNTNDYEVHNGFLRILRCILTTNHLAAGKPIVEHIKRMLKDKNNFKGKALFIVHSLSDIPFARALMIYEDIPEVLIPLIPIPEFTKLVMKIFEYFFNTEYTTSDDEKFTYSEDLPAINQIQQFILTIRELLQFSIPGAEEMTMDEDEDPLYSDFKKQKPKSNHVSIETTQSVLNTLKVLSNNVVGRSLIVCGYYPYKESLSPIEFGGFLRRITVGLYQTEWQESCLSLLNSFVALLKNIGSNIITHEALANISSAVKNAYSNKANGILQALTLLPQKPDIQYIELPKHRELNVKFAVKSPDFAKIKDYGKAIRKNHFNQLVHGKRFGEKPQVKAVQYLTDLLPPPYPPQFKFKSEIKKEDLMVFAEPHQELTVIKVQEKQKAFEEKMKKLQPPGGYVASAPVEIMMPKAPIQQIVPIQQAPQQYTRNLTLPVQSPLTDVEKNAFNELAALLQKKDRSHDPRLQYRIEQILSDYPNLCSYLKN